MRNVYRKPKTRGFEVSLEESRAADSKPLPDELLEMKEAGELPEEASGPSMREQFATKVAPLLDRIPPIEADMVSMYFFYGKTETDLAHIFEMTQAAVSYRVEKALRRIRWLASVPPITETDVTSTLPLYGFAAWEVELLAGMHRTTNVTEMSRRMGFSQARTRVRFYRLVDRLQELAKLDDAVRPYAEYFEAVRQAPSILWNQATDKMTAAAARRKRRTGT